MRLMSIFALVVAALCPSSLSAVGKSEHWQAFSKTATAITGDIDLSPTRLRAGGVTFPLKVAEDIPHFAGDTGETTARVLAVVRPSRPIMLNSNTFCGRDLVRWIAVWRVDKATLGMAVFSSKKMPTDETDQGSCGIYYYVR
jgi:hypothetical protein